MVVERWPKKAGCILPRFHAGPCFTSEESMVEYIESVTNMQRARIEALSFELHWAYRVIGVLVREEGLVTDFKGGMADTGKEYCRRLTAATKRRASQGKPTGR